MTQTGSTGRWRCGDIEIDAPSREIRRCGEVREVEPKVFDLIVALIRHRDRVVTKDELLERIWPGSIVTESALTRCIMKARRAMGDDAQRQQAIRTISGRGYRFLGPVEPLESPASQSRADGATEEPGPSIAVVPFRPLADDLELTYLGQGIAEDVGTLLAHLPGFFVISQGSTVDLAASDKTAEEKGRRLGVRYLVEGSLRPLTDRLRVSVRLVEVPGGRSLWAEQMNCRREELRTLPDHLARAIVARVEPELARAELASLHRRVPADLDAWEAFRRAQGLVSLQGWNEATFAEAADLMRASVEKDPDFAAGHAFLALVRAMGRLVGLADDPDAALAEAVTAADRALELETRDSVVLGLAGCALSDIGDVERGTRVIERAVESDPSNAQAWAALGASMLRAGQVDRGIECLRYGLRISPLDARRAAWRSMLASGLLQAGRLEECIEEAEQACRVDEKLFWPWLILATAQAARGRPEEGRRAFERALTARPAISRRHPRGPGCADGYRILGKSQLLRNLPPDPDG